MNLVIVESPTKAKTISRFLGKNFKVESSMGHIRDLPKSKMGVDVDNGFTPTYVIPKDKSKVVTALKKLAGKASTIYLATDEDREGEAIAWHLTHALGLDHKTQNTEQRVKLNAQAPSSKLQAPNVKRITFHEITKPAIEHALANPRDLDLKLVDAQQARRVLDRLVGYELSPLLWKKVAKGLSAGRVQSVAVRLIAEREREIQAFKPQEYWTIEATLTKKNVIANEAKQPPEDRHDRLRSLAMTNEGVFTAKLQAINGKPVEKFDITNETRANEIVAHLQGKHWIVASVTSKKATRKPQPPFTTSTLQQEANRKLAYSAYKTMVLAQQLYEGVELGTEGLVGLITYMRTDSVNLADKFLQEAQQYLSAMGSAYAQQAPRRYITKSKLAQEAHEAIRPTDVSRTPNSIHAYLKPEQYKLYDLIWRRALASQMPDAILNQVIIDVSVTASPSSKLQAPSSVFTFRATGSTIVFDGFLKLYPDGAKEVFLPIVTKGDEVYPKEVKPIQHFTEPKARYTEASLIRALEELGIGRPSTYAPTISTIQERNYVVREDKRLKPTDIGLLVNDLLVEHFPSVVDYQFTARMEDELDDIAQGKRAWQPVIKEFYEPFKQQLSEKERTLSKKELTTESTDETCDKCGKPMIIRVGRFGRFLACTGFPECKNTKPLAGNGQTQTNGVGTINELPLLQERYKNETCASCESPMIVKSGRFGPFLSCSKYPKCKTIKNIEQSTGAKCPQCGQGEIVAKKSRRGKTFYSCNRYPECKFALWSRPTGDKCPQCQSLLAFVAKNSVRCSNKECKYKRDATVPNIY